MRTREFKLASTEMADAAKFMVEHEALHGKNEVREGPRYTFRITPDNVGQHSSISCATCGVKVSITDVDLW
jgi:hypothetical protein